MGHTISDTKKKKIRKYWRTHKGNSYFNPDWDDTEKTCFACGIDGKTVDAAHIIGRWMVGESDNSFKNIHLLCRVCHTNSENLTGGAYWYWLKLMKKTYIKGKITNQSIVGFEDGTLPIIVINELIFISRKSCAMQGAEFMFDIFNKNGESLCPDEEYITNPSRVGE